MNETLKSQHRKGGSISIPMMSPVLPTSPNKYSFMWPADDAENSEQDPQATASPRWNCFQVE